MICQMFVAGSCDCGAKLCKRCGRCHSVLCELKVVHCRFQYANRKEPLHMDRHAGTSSRGALRRLRRRKWHVA